MHLHSQTAVRQPLPVHCLCACVHLFTTVWAAPCAFGPAALEDGAEGTVKWHKEHCWEPFNGDDGYCGMSYSVAMLRSMLDGRMGKGAFNDHIKMLASGFGTLWKRMPSSLHIMEGMVDKEPWTNYMYHVCPGAQPEFNTNTNTAPCTGFVYDWLDPKEWAAHADDQCPLCTRQRCDGGMACHVARCCACQPWLCFPSGCAELCVHACRFQPRDPDARGNAPPKVDAAGSANDLFRHVLKRLCQHLGGRLAACQLHGFGRLRFCRLLNLQRRHPCMTVTTVH